MKIPTHNFNKLATHSAPHKPKKDKPTPFSLRLTFEERARLEDDAAGMSLGAYVRERLFGEETAPRKTRGKFPVKDHEALGRVLGALGSSRLSSNLNQLAKAVNTGSLPVTPETEEDLREACAAGWSCAKSCFLRSGVVVALNMTSCGASHDPQGQGTWRRRAACLLPALDAGKRSRRAA